MESATFTLDHWSNKKNNRHFSVQSSELPNNWHNCPNWQNDQNIYMLKPTENGNTTWDNDPNIYMLNPGVPCQNESKYVKSTSKSEEK